VMVIKPLNR